jgi:hypothetical protein
VIASGYFLKLGLAPRRQLALHQADVGRNRRALPTHVGPAGAEYAGAVGGPPAHARHIALLDEYAILPPNCRRCATLDHRLHSASYSGRRLGFGCGVSGASITRRSLAQLPSSFGGRMLQATNCVPAHAVLIAAEKARPSSGQAGPAIISGSIRFRSVCLA